MADKIIIVGEGNDAVYYDGDDKAKAVEEYAKIHGCDEASKAPVKEETLTDYKDK